MDDNPTKPPTARRAGITADRKRLLVAARLQEIAGNPLTAEDIAMFEMFEQEGWSNERRRAYILTMKPHLPR
jgi:hypothetical protein